MTYYHVTNRLMGYNEYIIIMNSLCMIAEWFRFIEEHRNPVMFFFVI